MELNDVEEDILTADKGLTELVNEFTEEKAVLTDGKFSGVIESFKIETGKRQTNIREAIKGLVNEIPLPSQVKDICSTLESLAEEYICSEIGMKYNRLSPQLFKLKRKITIDQKDYYGNKKITLAIPLFADVRFGGSVWKLEKACDFDEKEYKVDIKAKAPPITREVKEKARNIRADYMEICSKALKEVTIGDILLRDIDSTPMLNLRTYWTPSLSEFDIKVREINKDPILVANIYGRYYLTAVWNVKGEEPYEHYVKEFTEEKAKLYQ